MPLSGFSRTPASTTRLDLIGILISFERQGEERKWHEALISSSLPANRVIFNLSAQEVVGELRKCSPVTLKVVNAATTDP
jgi:hypothetical protein